MIELFQTIADYGAGALILFAAGWLFFKILLDKTSKRISGLFSDNGTKDEETGFAVSDLRFHPLFSTIEYKINIEIPSVEFNNKQPVKQEMFRDLIILYMQSIKDGCYQIAVREDIYNFTADRWAAEVNEAFNRTVTEFQRRALDNGIPATVLNKFSRWNANAVRTIHDYIYHLSGGYGSNFERTSTFFLIISLLMTTCVIDGDKAFRDLNQELMGKTYKGQPLEY